MQSNVQPSTSARIPAATCDARRPGWDQGPAVGRHRIPCVQPSGHDGDHRDGLGQAWPLDEQAGGRGFVYRTLPAVAEFLASEGASGEVHLTRVDAPQVTDAEALDAYREFYDEYRTHTIRLLDSPGATLTVRCPAWCESGHAEDTTHGTFLVDFAHRGAEEALHVDLGDGHEDVLLVEITQYPFGRDMRTPVALLWPTLGMGEVELDPDKLASLAGQLREYAEALDMLTKRLEAAREQSAQARRHDHEGRWTK